MKGEEAIMKIKLTQVLYHPQLGMYVSKKNNLEEYVDEMSTHVLEFTEYVGEALDVYPQSHDDFNFASRVLVKGIKVMDIVMEEAEFTRVRKGK